MEFNFDVTLVILFFIFILTIGVLKIHKSENINEFAIGRRSFSTAALTHTISATWISGSGFFTDLSRSYSDGWYYLLPALCMSFALYCLAVIFIPRMQEFLGSTSVASAMSSIYGIKTGRIIAILASLGLCGSIAVQFKAMGIILTYFFKSADYIPDEIINIISRLFDYDNQQAITTIYTFLLAIIVVFYSFVGGIKSVVRTDIAQNNVIIICTIFLFLTCFWNFIQTPIQHYENVSYKKFDLSYVITTIDGNWKDMMILLFYFATPSINPASFQRVSMALNLRQAKDAWLKASVILFGFTLFISLISFMTFKVNPTLNQNEVIYFFIEQYSFTGLKGLIVIGVLSMSMSTADSMLNISAVMISNDIWKVNTWSKIDKLYYARIFTIVIGILSLGFCFYSDNLLKIILLSSSFYMPIVTPLLYFTIFGYRSTSRCILSCIYIVLALVIIIQFLKHFGDPNMINIDPIISGMIISFVTLPLLHYSFEKNKPFYTGIKDDGYFELYKYRRSNKVYRLKRLLMSYVNRMELVHAQFMYSALYDYLSNNLDEEFNEKYFIKKYCHSKKEFKSTIDELINLRWIYKEGKQYKLLLTRVN